MGAGKGAFYYNEKDTSHDPGLHAGGSSGPDRLQPKRFRFLRQHEHEHGRSSSQTGQAGQNAAYRTGLGILTEASDQERAGKIDTIAAAVLLDAEGRVADVMLDEVEISVTGDSTGKVTMPTDDRTKRQKGDDYPLAAVSSLKKAGQSRRMPLAIILPAKPRMR